MADQRKDTLVWCEIPVSDFDKGLAYYGRVLGCELQVNREGPDPMGVFPYSEPGISGHIYPGSPASGGRGPTVHLAVSVLEEALERVKAAGGEVLPGIVPMPFGRFAYTVDPDGNSIGLFQAAGD